MARFAVALSLVLFVASGAVAQTGGILPFSTQAGGGVDSFDLATSNIYLQIPVRSKPGAVPAQFSLVLNSNAYISNGTWVVSGGLAGTPLKTGLRLTATTTLLQTCGSSNKDVVFSAFSLIDPTGASHSLPGVTIDTLGCYPPPVNPVVASDHSGFAVQFAGVFGGGTAYEPSGNSVPVGIFGTLPSTTLTDPDGNTLQYSFTPSTGVMSFTDTLGYVAVSGTIHSSSTPGSQSSAETYQYTDLNGSNQPFTVTYTGKVQRTVFGCSGVNDINTGSTLVYFPTKVALPGGSSYQIGYETTTGHTADVTGRIASITLPGGGIISYSYSDTAGHNGMNCGSQVVPKLSRKVDDNNGHASTWTYTSTRAGGSPDNYTVTETDPLSDTITHYFSGEYETKRSVTDVNLGVLSTTVICYNGTFISCPAPTSTVASPITQTDVYSALGSSTSSLIETTHDSYGNVTEVKSYNSQTAGAAPSGSPILDHKLVYGTLSGSACVPLTNTNIHDRVCADEYFPNGGSSLGKETTFIRNGNGHATQTNHWVNGSGATLTSYATYNSNGTVATSTDVDGAVTRFNYDGSCNSIVPTSTNLPTVNVAMSTSQTWYCKGGAVSTSTDVNGGVTTYTYNDPFWRLTHVLYPNGGAKNISYTTGSTTPWSVSSSTSITTAWAFQTTTYMDGLGRPYETLLTSDPGGTDEADTTYDLLGRVNSTSNPYRSNTDPTYGITSYSYDALGRTLLVTNPDSSARQTTYANRTTNTCREGSSVCKFFQTDDLRRVTSACDRTSVNQANGAAPVSSCNSDYPNHPGFVTSYTYDSFNRLTQVSQAGLQNRTFTYDGLDRPLSAYNPESGTVTYGYDTQNAGDLYTRTAPLENHVSGSVVTTYT